MALENKKFFGEPASPGIAIAKVYVYKRNPLEIVEREPDLPCCEVAKFIRAIRKAKKDLEKIKYRLRKKEKHLAKIIDAQIAMVTDPKLFERTVQLINEGNCAEKAFKKATDEILEILGSLEDGIIKERLIDVKDIAERILTNLMGQIYDRDASLLEEKHIAVASIFTPTDVSQFTGDKIMGIATDAGSKLSHIAIMAKALGIPAVLGLKHLTKYVKDGDLLIVDGNEGIVILNPTEDVLRTYERRKEKLVAYKRGLEEWTKLPCETIDGYEIELSSNIEFPEEVKDVVKYGAYGVGLMRTEALLFKRRVLSEEEQFLTYYEVARKLHPRPVIIRVLDVGADKLMPDSGYEPNPALGLRALRLLLREKQDMLRAQLRAILRASALKNIKIMIPMVSTVDELLAFKDILEEVKEELKREDVKFDEKIEFGIMIETPSAALISRELARYCNFFSIGTNDLTQYTLACDRTNPSVAYLYNSFHPSVLKLIKLTIESGHAEGIWVGVCGEMAGDPLAIPILIGFGIDELSVPPAFVPIVKKIVRSITLAEAKEIAEKS